MCYREELLQISRRLEPIEFPSDRGTTGVVRRSRHPNVAERITHTLFLRRDENHRQERLMHKEYPLWRKRAQYSCCNIRMFRQFDPEPRRKRRKADTDEFRL
jgi:hypothetical protein